MAYFRKRGEKWSFTMDVGKDPITGKRKQITKGGFKTKKAAQEEVAKVTNDLANGDYENSDIRFSQLVEIWMQEKESSCRPSTLYQYKRILRSRVMPEFGEKRLSDIKPLTVHNFHQKLLKEGLTTKYISSVDVMLKQILDKGVELEMINSNPAKKAKRPKVKKKAQASWTIEEAMKFMEYAKIQGSYYIAFVLALHTGMRIGEVLALQWKDINFESKIIHVQRTLTLVDGKYELGETKTEASNRMIPMTEELMGELLEYQSHKKDNSFDLLICTRNKKIVHPYTIRYQMKALCEAIDVPYIRFHDIRRTFTTILIDSGANAKVVSKLLGHTNVSTTLNIYTDVYEERQIEVTEMLGNVLKSGRSGQKVVSEEKQED
ncbi:integrase [Bacillus cereus]|uniref:site-specific integrase n=1 Tax=Bacillus cereus TaxID=1396 RepID=UPI0007B6C05F|nr:site-specific integrase [Bacillus cereus]ANC20992.1 integrase [Bacillus cereus]EKS7876230.1 site-specific integrase [Bacillus cereus]PEU62205.1 site-specific integrase [Bacillus cereus]